MTKETFEKANKFMAAIRGYEHDINSFEKALDDQTIEKPYSEDTFVEIYDRNGKAIRLYIPRQCVIEMLESAIDMRQKEKAKLQAELEEL